MDSGPNTTPAPPNLDPGGTTPMAAPATPSAPTTRATPDNPAPPATAGSLAEPGSGPVADQAGQVGKDRLSVHFTGSGSEYFRIWVVNLLLTVVTLGLYYPWARVRRLQYFASNTWVGNDRFGRYPLEFTANPARMLRAYVVMVVLLLVYVVTSNLSVAISSLAFLALTAMVPVFTWAGLRFRLGNTRWRGLRFSFAGSIAGAYLAYLPLLLAFVASTLVFASGFLAFAGADEPVDASRLGWLDFGLFGLTAIGGLAWLVTLFRLIRYRQDHLRFGDIRTRLDLGLGSYLWLLVRAAGLSILLAVILIPTMLAVLWFAGALSSALQTRSGDDPVLTRTVVGLLLPTVFLLGLAWQVFVRSWLVAREQNLVWSNTRGSRFTFNSRLRARAYVARNLLNWLLIVITLGLYQPFAVVALARLRLDALSIDTDGDPAAIVAAAEAAPGVAGDAGADVFGVDIGL